MPKVVMMTYTDKDRIIAIAGIFQSAGLVHTLATTGKVSETLFENSINTLFIMNPDQVNDIYTHRAIIAGTGLLKDTLLRKTDKSSHRILQYVLNLIQLEIKLQKNPTLQSVIRQRIHQAMRQKEHFEKMSDTSAFNATVIANLASIYKESISSLTPRVQVAGQPHYLQKEAIADQIRALLLAGIRSAILWRQMGGRRWHLIFLRGKLLKIINTEFNINH